MPITIACPNCKAKLKAPDSAVGKTVKCPKCATPVRVGWVTPDLPIAEVYTPPAVPPDIPAVNVAQAEPTKDCPFCGETVKASAKRCKHCGETIDVGLRAAEEAKRAADDARRAADRAAARPSTPMVFMNAGGAAASSSSSAAAAASSGRRRYRSQPFFTCLGCAGLAVFLACAGLCGIGFYGSSRVTAEAKKTLAEADANWDAGKKAEAVSVYKENYVFSEDKEKLVARIVDYEATAGNAAEARKWVERGLDERRTVSYQTPAAHSVYA
jgi:hypothetical protein